LLINQVILAALNEHGGYTEEFLRPFRERLDSLKQILTQDSEDGKHPEPIVRLMSKKIEGVGEYTAGLTACLPELTIVRAPAE